MGLFLEYDLDGHEFVSRRTQNMAGLSRARSGTVLGSRHILITPDTET